MAFRLHKLKGRVLESKKQLNARSVAYKTEEEAEVTGFSNILTQEDQQTGIFKIAKQMTMARCDYS